MHRQPPRLALFGILALGASAAQACHHGDVPAGAGASGGAAATTTSASSASSSAVATSTSGTGGTGGAGCGAGGDGTPSNVYPAPHPAPPQGVDSGGDVLAAPRIVPIFFADEAPARVAALEDFAGKVGTSQFWSAATAEYGVGPLTSEPGIHLTETAPATLDDPTVRAWLAGKLNGDDPAFPTMPYGDAIFVIHYPVGVTITFTDGMGAVSQSCVNFGGYHDAITLDGSHGSLEVAYAVLPACSTNWGEVGVDATTSAESHELVEAVTDPHPDTLPAFASMDHHHVYWESFFYGGELGDMCTPVPGVFTTFPDLPYAVQRTWSNAAAMAGHDPCVPKLPGSVYFNAVPVLPDEVVATVFGQEYGTQGVRIPVGGTRTIELDLFSDGDTGGPFSVDVTNAGPTFGDFQSDVTYTLDNAGGENGQKLYLTITVNVPGPDDTETFLVTSTLGATQSYWLGIVGN